MQTIDSVKSLCADVAYSDWKLLVHPSEGRILIQWAWDSVDLARMAAPDGPPPEPLPCRGRKWVISEFATDCEVVQTALLALLTALEHEAREQFRYKGVAIFNPHMSLDALMENAGRTQKRPPMRPASAWPFPSGDPTFPV